MSDVSDRLKTRRQFAYVSFCIVTMYGIVGLVSMFDDDLTKRLIDGWGPHSTLFSGFMLYVGYYARLGSSETKESMRLGASNLSGS